MVCKLDEGSIRSVMGSNPATFLAETTRQKMHKGPGKDRTKSIILILKYLLLDFSWVMVTRNRNISVAAFVDFLAEICFENSFFLVETVSKQKFRR